MGRAAQIAAGQIRDQLAASRRQSAGSAHRRSGIERPALAGQRRAGKEPHVSAAFSRHLRRSERQFVRQSHAAHRRRRRRQNRPGQRFVASGSTRRPAPKSKSILKPARSVCCASSPPWTSAKRFIRGNAISRTKARRSPAWVRRSSKKCASTTASRSTARFSTTCCRRCSIIPVEFHSLLVETPHPDGPFGAKGMGEAALPPMAAAIGNAVANALERRPRARPADQAGQDRRGDPRSEGKPLT